MQTAARASASADGFFTMTYRFLCGDGSFRWIEATYHRVDAGGESFVVGSVRDVAERKEADVILQHRASTDPLTGVANRTVLMDRLQHALHRLSRSSGILAVLFLDLDRFKVINDSLGHQIGDGVLMSMAERLQQFIRPADTLARLGGDEFVIVAEDLTDEHEAVVLGDRIASAGRKPFRIGAEEFVCTVSVGIATTADTHHVPERLLQEADLALYRAKDRGRDRAEVFDEDLRTTAVGRLGTERMLRRAIDEERLRVQYQPIIDLRSGRVVSVEALVRVLDPQLGLLEPDSFLEVAEETGLLATMDEWVFARGPPRGDRLVRSPRLDALPEVEPQRHLAPRGRRELLRRRHRRPRFEGPLTAAASRSRSPSACSWRPPTRRWPGCGPSARAGSRWVWTTSGRASRRSPISGSSRSTS